MTTIISQNQQLFTVVPLSGVFAIQSPEDITWKYQGWCPSYSALYAQLEGYLYEIEGVLEDETNPNSAIVTSLILVTGSKSDMLALANTLILEACE